MPVYFLSLSVSPEIKSYAYEDAASPNPFQFPCLQCPRDRVQGDYVTVTELYYAVQEGDR